MKKTTSKTSKSPAPATASKPPSKKTPAAKSTVAVATAPLTETPAAMPTAMPKVTITVPTVKATASTPVQTKIIARVDVGFGNLLYIRGEGPGLSWDKGIPMECAGADHWEITLGESARPISFKLLMNDSTWCTGPDSVAASGSTVTLTPEFA